MSDMKKKTKFLSFLFTSHLPTTSMLKPTCRGRVIFALWGSKGVPIKILCDKTGLDKSTLTGILNRLERDGYITKTKDESDKRSTLIRLTGKQDIFTDEIQKVSDEMNEVFYKNFTDNEIDQFESLLQRVLDNCRDAER